MHQWAALMNSQQLVRLRTTYVCALVLTLLCFSHFTERCAAQRPQYSLRVEVMIQPQPAYRLHTQKWGRELQKAGRSIVFRSGRSGEKTRVENSKFGGRNSVTAVGLMNRNGTITLQGKTYVITNLQPLLEWMPKAGSLWRRRATKSKSHMGTDATTVRQCPENC